MSLQILQCDKKRDCKELVTHIGEKGYIYCTEHALDRRLYAGHKTRKMRVWEIRLLQRGGVVPSYRPITKAEAERRTANAV